MPVKTRVSIALVLAATGILCFRAVSTVVSDTRHFIRIAVARLSMTDADSSWKRRTVLQAGLAATGAGLLSPTVRGAAATSADRRPLYVTGPGGSPYPWTQYTIILDTDEVEKADPADSNDVVFHSSFQGETVITGRVVKQTSISTSMTARGGFSSSA